MAEKLAQNINQYFSSRSSFGLCFCVYQVKRFSFIKSNQFRLVLIFKTRTKHQTKPANNYKFEPNFHSKFYCQWNFTEFGWTVVSRHWYGKKSFRKWSSDRSSPNSIRSFSAKDYLSGFRSLREEIGNVQTKRNRKNKPDERQSQRTKQNNTQQQTKTKSEFLFLG